jgi:sulfatase maturation enzyme AslB (radical SAM superfamily)
MSWSLNELSVPLLADQVVKNIYEDHKETIYQINFAGGEPLLNPFFWDVLTNCKGIEFGMHTNGTLSSFKDHDIFEILLNSNNLIEFHLTLDALWSKLEYQRHGIDSRTVLSNLMKYNDVFGQRRRKNLHIKDRFYVSVTSSAYTALYYDDLYNFLYHGNFTFYGQIKHCPVYYPRHLSAAVLPTTFKRKILQDISKHTRRELFIDSFKQILSSESTEEDRRKFIDNSLEYDAIRDTNFKSTFPELSFLVGNEKYFKTGDI